MTMPHLWFPSLGAAPPVAGFTLQAQGTFGSTSFSTPGTITIPASYTTQLNDCIIVAYSVTNVHPATFSAAGATWVSIQADTNQTAGLAYGYGCSAGNTSFTLSVGSGGQTVSLAIAVYAGVQFSSDPVGANHNQGTTGGGHVTSLGSGAVSYGATNLLISASSDESADLTGTTWSNGNPNTNLGHLFQASTESSSLDTTSSATGSSTSATAAGGSGKMRVVVASFAHA